MKRFISLISVLFALLVLTALAEEANRTLVAQSERLSLYLYEDLCRIDVEDGLTGKVWSSSMNDETAAGIKIIPAQQKKINSLLAINCTNIDKGMGVVNNMALLGENSLSASSELITDGVRLNYTFGSFGISVSIELTLDGNDLLVRVPFDHIREEKEFGLVSVDALPYMFSATDLSEGFFLYPDGCGAIMEFKDPAHYKEQTRQYTVYGDMIKLDSLLDMFDEGAPLTLMPVFGMNRGGHGLLAIIEEGAESSKISVNSSNNIIGLNYMFASFQYRRNFEDKRTASRDIKTYDKAAMEQDYTMRILFLEEDEADYSVMAVSWREYLLKNGMVNRKTIEPACAIDIFMTTPEEGLLYDSPKTVTTFSQAEEILQELTKSGVSNIHASIKGWSSDGYGKTPDRFPVSSSIGGNKGLKRFVQTAHELGVEVTLTVNVCEAKSDQGGYSHRNDVVYTGNHAVLTDRDEEVFILSADVSAAKLNGIISKAADYGLDGLKLERIGMFAPYNYSAARAMSGSEGMRYFESMLSAAGEIFAHVQAEGGNVWSLRSVDMVTGVPYEDYGYQITTRSVPFYQIALHGIVDYTYRPGNLSSDLDREVLRWVEMGYTPYFELTYLGTEELMYTEYQHLFSASFREWLERVSEACEMFTDGELKELSDKYIIKHEYISDTLAKITYEDGSVIYVNYGAEVEIDGLLLPARDYVLVRGR